MNQPPRQQNDDDVRLSDDQIRAMAQGLKSQYASQDRSMVGSVGSAVVGGVEGMLSRLLVLLRLPLILLAGLAGFLLTTGKDGVSLVGALAIGIAAALACAALIGMLLRFVELRAYRREIR